MLCKTVFSKPSAKVRFVPADDIYSHAKDANIIHKIRMACLQPDMAEEFLLCSDDQLVMMPSAWEDFEPRWMRVWSEEDAGWYDQSLWHKRLRDTLRRFGPGAWYFQPHMWTQVKKAEFLSMCEEFQYKTETACTVFSLYLNYAWRRVHGDTEPKANFDHAYCRTPVPPVDVRHMAYDDGAFCKQEFRNWLSDRFRKPCVYEREFNGAIK
jgi:hypothetical protein